MRALLILIVVLAIALVAGDRVAVVLAQNEIGRRVATEYDLAHPPSVHIRGFPFLTQAVDGHYRDIDVRVGDWSDEKISVHDLDITLTDVSAPLNDLIHQQTSNIVAETATATAVVPYDTVKSFAPTDVQSIANGPQGLRVTGTFLVDGVSVPATVDVTVAPADDGIIVTPVAVQSAAGGPVISLASIRQFVTFTIPLRQLPLGARLTAIEPHPDGLHVAAVAHTVRLSSLER
ncbi:hypothetical protein BJY24_004996 [Nocardia transvalensis]|uniref:DUF2993 family protein n=1 Tax=Nocardia transvalensis TaxID=37333 RepID=A0A7W9UK46_9NOCA|nr:DUF2993 domain-containing protein [Nocardia transvalensis]MBB5916084.1 hypothetical protein [Nocardia transvalensis]